jgi:NifU-like protein involved in Fe-S cluster formation
MTLFSVPKFNYHENVIDHYENPRNVGSLDKKDPKVGTGKFISTPGDIVIHEIVSGLVGAPACGDVMKLQIKVGDDGKTIEQAVFKVEFA